VIVWNDESEVIYEEFIVACLGEDISIRRNKHKHGENVREEREKTDIDNTTQKLTEEVGNYTERVSANRIPKWMPGTSKAKVEGIVLILVAGRG
jgi:hypothetical protein